MNVLKTVALVLALGGSSTMFGQELKSIDLLGPNCTSENTVVSGDAEIKTLNLLFNGLTLSAPAKNDSVNTVHCKFQVNLRAEKGYLIDLYSLDVVVDSLGDSPLRAKLMVNLFDGQKIRYSDPLVTRLRTADLPKVVRINRLGLGSEGANCYGDVVPYQVTLFLVSDSFADPLIEVPGAIQIKAIENVQYKLHKC